jgi:hypothetical protein
MAQEKPENEPVNAVRLPDISKMTDEEIDAYVPELWKMIMEGMKKNKILMEKKAKKAEEQEKSDS